ncbi:MAG: 2OG-Fe(II) oxygenase [Gammaproteobacteria bacterium]|nr:2OG-Fe(II) oxygenase [Gammaproteobacteria bacterium]
MKPGAVDVHDGLITERMVSELFASIHQPVYRFGQKSNPGDAFGFWIANISDDVRQSVPPLRRLWQTVDEHINEGACEIERMYVNAYNYGDCPTIHTDRSEEGYYTVLYYANEEWDANWSGETVFYNDARNEIVKSVFPKPGRIVAFDSRIPHVAREPNRICPVVRYTIAIKLAPRQG